MRAAVLRAPQAPIEIADIPRPKPGTGEVLIRMEACGICHSDLFLAGRPKMPMIPLVLGHEGIGIVEELGPGVDKLRLGERVGMGFLYRSCGDCSYCRSGRENYCPKRLETGYTAQGALAEYAVAAEAFVARIPDGLPAMQAAPLCCAGLTAYQALRTVGLAAGEWVAIFGAGGLGHLAIQIAKHWGLKVALVDVTPEKLEQAVRLGADLVINGAVQSPREALKAVGGASAAITFTNARPAIEQAFPTLRPNGILVLVGLCTEPFALPVLQTVLQGLRISGILVGTPRDLQEIVNLAASGVAHVDVEPCRLDDVPAVFERMRQGKILGRAVVEF